jgi:hypothetical protein
VVHIANKKGRNVVTERSMVSGWKRSTQCGNGACVEVAIGARNILTRDAKAPADPFLSFTRPAWTGFMGEIKAGRLIGNR